MIEKAKEFFDNRGIFDTCLTELSKILKYKWTQFNLTNSITSFFL